MRPDSWAHRLACYPTARSPWRSWYPWCIRAPLRLVISGRGFWLSAEPLTDSRPNLGRLEWWNGQLHLLITPHQCRMRMRARSTSFRNHFSSSLHSAYLYTKSICFQCIVNAYMYSKYLYTRSICFTSILSAWFVYSRFQKKKNYYLNTNTEGCVVSYQQMFSQLTSLVQYTFPRKKKTRQQKT
jgi:hypothetical protein